MHFATSELLVEPGVPAPEAWARAIGAALVPQSRGVLLDCGWSAWWRESGAGDVALLAAWPVG